MRYKKTLFKELVSSGNYTRDKEELQAVRYKAIQMAHRFHFEHNDVYYEFCQLKGIGPKVYPDDFHKLLLPDRVFKSYLMDNPKQHPENFNTWLDTVSSPPLDFVPEDPGSLTNLLHKNLENTGFS